MFLITAHEFGHFLMARKNGVTVKEFGIGFPPRIIAWVRKDNKWVRLPKKDWEKTQKSLIFSLNILPIGGFCSMDGESDADTRKGTFGAASFWQKTKILFGGVMMNWLVAFIILTILAFTGMPKFIDNQFFIKSDTSSNDTPVYVAEVVESSPAAKAGLKAGDQVTDAIDWSLQVNNTTKIDSATALTDYNKAHAGKNVTYRVYREDIEGEPYDDSVEDQHIKFIDVTLNDEDAEYLLGITMRQEGQSLYRATWSAPIVGAATTLQLTGETFKGLGQIIWNLASGTVQQFSTDESTRQAGKEAISTVGDSVSGPVGIIGVIFPAFAETGPTNIAFLAAVISISLACMNVLPIPALDGGRWLLIAIYRLRKKPLDQETEARIVSRAFFFLLALIIAITILDITRFF